MKNKLRLFFAFVLVIISGFLLINSQYIVAFAKSMDVEEYEPGKVYNKGDELLLYLNTEEGNKITEGVYVAYLDSDDKLLDFHSVVYAFGSGQVIESFFIGDTCVETNERHPEYDEKGYYFEFRCDNSYTEIFNYPIDEDKLHEVEHWKLLDNEDKNVVDYCLNYEWDLPFCDYVVENRYSSGVSYLVDYIPLLVFKEYQKPVFNMVCDSEVIKYGEKVNCKLSINSTDQLDSFKTSLDNEHFDISNLQVIEGWQYEKDDDGSYIFIKDNDSTAGVDVFSFIVSPKEKKAMESSVIANDFSFTTSFGLEEKINVSTKLNIEAEKVDNPNTFAFNYLILFIVITCGVGLIFIIKPKKQYE